MFVGAAVVGALGWALLSQEIPLLGLLLCLAAVGLLIYGLFTFTSERLSEQEYENLPGAVGERGHQCLACGNRGIYRHTPYKTNTTLADCSKCKLELWHE